MTNTTPLVPVDLDKRRHLRVDLNAMCKIEEATGLAFSDIDPNKISSMRLFLWAALLHEDSALTVDEVGSWVHSGNLADVNQAINIALGIAVPSSESDADFPKNTSGSTGSNSGQSGAMISD